MNGLSLGPGRDWADPLFHVRRVERVDRRAVALTTALACLIVTSPPPPLNSPASDGAAGRGPVASVWRSHPTPGTPTAPIRGAAASAGIPLWWTASWRPTRCHTTHPEGARGAHNGLVGGSAPPVLPPAEHGARLRRRARAFGGVGASPAGRTREPRAQTRRPDACFRACRAAAWLRPLPWRGGACATSHCGAGAARARRHPRGVALAGRGGPRDPSGGRIDADGGRGCEPNITRDAHSGVPWRGVPAIESIGRDTKQRRRVPASRLTGAVRALSTTQAISIGYSILEPSPHP